MKKIRYGLERSPKERMGKNWLTLPAHDPATRSQMPPIPGARSTSSRFAPIPASWAHRIGDNRTRRNVFRASMGNRTHRSWVQVAWKRVLKLRAVKSWSNLRRPSAERRRRGNHQLIA